MYSGSVCPNCGSRHIRRSKRKGLWERAVLYSFGIRPYRCLKCDERFLRRGLDDPSANHRQPATAR